MSPKHNSRNHNNHHKKKPVDKENEWQKNQPYPALICIADDDNIEDEEDVVMTTTAPTQTSVRWTRDEEKLLINDDFNKSPKAVFFVPRYENVEMESIGNPHWSKVHAIYKRITRKSGENDGDVLEAAEGRIFGL
ncbi:hypothetical protein Tco_1248725 [Tanacetum coccineum]